MRTQPVPLPNVVRCSYCGSEWATNQLDCPRVGATCRCKRGVIEALEGE